MAISIKPIDAANRPTFAGQVSGIDLTRRLDDGEVAAIHAGMDRYGVLVFHDQQLDDDRQTAFSRQLGPLEQATGDIAAPQDRRVSLDLNDISPAVAVALARPAQGRCWMPAIEWRWPDAGVNCWSERLPSRRPAHLRSAYRPMSPDPAQVDALFALTRRPFGRADVLFNNAGVKRPASCSRISHSRSGRPSSTST